jgi:hypothetical protein
MSASGYDRYPSELFASLNIVATFSNGGAQASALVMLRRINEALPLLKEQLTSVLPNAKEDKSGWSASRARAALCNARRFQAPLLV